jgi:hypothetical protein
MDAVVVEGFSDQGRSRPTCMLANTAEAVASSVMGEISRRFERAVTTAWIIVALAYW